MVAKVVKKKQMSKFGLKNCEGSDFCGLFEEG